MQKYLRTLKQAEEYLKFLAKEFGCNENELYIEKVKMADLTIWYRINEK